MNPASARDLIVLLKLFFLIIDPTKLKQEAHLWERLLQHAVKDNRDGQAPIGHVHYLHI